MAKDFYMIVNGNDFPADVAWGRNAKYEAYRKARNEAERVAKEQRQAIGRFMKADKRRNHFQTREEAEQYIIKMGLPFRCKIAEAFFAF